MEEIGRRWVDGVEGIWVSVCVCVGLCERLKEGCLMEAECHHPVGREIRNPYQQDSHPHTSRRSVCVSVYVYVCGRGPPGKVQSCKVSPCSSSRYLLSLQPVLLSPPPPALHCITALLFLRVKLTHTLHTTYRIWKYVFFTSARRKRYFKVENAAWKGHEPHAQTRLSASSLKMHLYCLFNWAYVMLK